MRLAQGRIVCVAIAVLIFSSVVSFAETIQVTTLNDELNNDTDCSLREAVQAANTNSPVSGCDAGDAGLDIIKLGSGTYSLTLPGKNEDNNATGDLDILESLEIMGSGAIISDGVSQPGVMGDGIRLIHVDPLGANGISLTLNGITLSNVDLGCSGALCSTGAGAIDVGGDGDLTIENGGLIDITRSCSGTNCGPQNIISVTEDPPDPGTGNPISFSRSTSGSARSEVGGIKMRGGDLTIQNSRFERVKSICEDKFCTPGIGVLSMTNGGNLTIESSTFVDNAISCRGTNGSFCGTDELIDFNNGSVSGDVVIRNSTFSDSIVECHGEDCDSDEYFEFDQADNLTMENVEIRNNTLYCTGPDCDTDELLSFNGSGDGDRLLDNVIIEGNTLLCIGVDCDTDELIESGTDDFSIIIRNSRILNNTLQCEGEACDVDEFIDDSSDDINASFLIENTEWINNVAHCIGLRCDSDDLFDLASGIDNASYEIRDSLFHRNKSTCNGEVCAVDSIISLDTDSTGVVTIENVVITENETVCSGQNCVVNGGPPDQGDPIVSDAELIQLSGNGAFLLINTTIAENVINRGRPIIEYDGSGGGSLTISKSAIASNVERSGGFTVLNSGTTTTTAINNWWGCNEGPNLDGCDTHSGTVTSDPWLIMTLEISPNPARVGNVARTIGTLSDPGALANVHFFTNSNGETIPNTIQRPVGFTIDQPAMISGLSGSAGVALFGLLGLFAAIALAVRNWQPLMRLGGRRVATALVILIFAAIGLTGCGLGNIPSQQATAVSFGGIAQVTITSNIPGQVTLTATADNETIIEQVFFIP